MAWDKQSEDKRRAVDVAAAPNGPILSAGANPQGLKQKMNLLVG